MSLAWLAPSRAQRRWRDLVALLLLTPLGSAQAAIDPQVPVVLVMNEHAFNVARSGPGTDGLGIFMVTGIISHFANKDAQEQVAEFKRRTPGIDWTALASESFSCFAMASQQQGHCRQVFVADSLQKADEFLVSQDAQRAILIEVLQMFRPASRYRARAVVHELARSAKGFDDVRMFTAQFEDYVPESLRNGAEKSKPEAEGYWSEGAPARLEAEGRRSLPELRELIDRLEAQVTDKTQAPPAWKQLPKIATLEEAGRAKCRGSPCSHVRVLEEHGERTWLVNDVPFPPTYGPVAVSFDAPALTLQSNLFMIVNVTF